MIQFKKACAITIYTGEKDEEGSEEFFAKGEKADGDILDYDKKDDTVDLQFGDGSVAFNVPRKLFIVKRK